MADEKLRLYLVHGSPPSYAVVAALTALELPFTTILLDYSKGEHRTDEHAKRNPQREVPVLEDGGFFLSESIAILQYLCDKHPARGEPWYPKDPQQRALVNHRLAFNVSSLYANLSLFVFGPYYHMKPSAVEIYRTKFLTNMSVLETIFSRQGTKFAAGDHATIADFSLVGAILCLEAVDFDFSEYSLVSAWYRNFKTEYSKIWNATRPCLETLKAFLKNAPKTTSE